MVESSNGTRVVVTAKLSMEQRTPLAPRTHLELFNLLQTFQPLLLTLLVEIFLVSLLFLLQRGQIGFHAGISLLDELGQTLRNDLTITQCQQSHTACKRHGKLLIYN